MTIQAGAFFVMVSGAMSELLMLCGCSHAQNFQHGMHPMVPQWGLMCMPKVTSQTHVRSTALANNTSTLNTPRSRLCAPSGLHSRPAHQGAAGMPGETWHEEVRQEGRSAGAADGPVQRQRCNVSDKQWEGRGRGRAGNAACAAVMLGCGGSLGVSGRDRSGQACRLAGTEVRGQGVTACVCFNIR